MTKSTTVYVCDNCGYHSAKWLGQCPECGEWGSLRQLRIKSEELRIKKGRSLQSLRSIQSVRLLRLNQIKPRSVKRIKTGIGELDRVLGGGIVPGSVVLFAGEPGIGKSTLLTQVALSLGSARPAGEPPTTIYICGEESPEQVRLRLTRLLSDQSDQSNNSDLLFLPETDIDLIIDQIANCKLQMVKLLIIDSIQTLYTTDLPGTAGSITQVRECTQRLIQLAKTKQMAIFLVGHVTKKGVLAGPKTIEHAVDTVLYFEGERSADLRLLRSVKNRFGPTDEVGVFQMTDAGLKEVINPEILLNSRPLNSKPPSGSAYTVVFEGTRPMVVEIQALVTKSFAPLPKRVINGLDRRRSEMLIAVLQKYLKIPLWEYDVFLNVAGGFRVTEPAADLAVCAALYSSYKNEALSVKAVFVGEVSLLGQVNPVSREDKRQKQAQALGLTDFYSDRNITSITQLKALFNSI